VIKVTVRSGVLALLAAAVVSVLGASAASARTTTVGLSGWQVQSSDQATQAGAQISTPGFATGSWLHVRPDDGARSAPRSTRWSRPATVRTRSSRPT
jgi:hypothetical protein